MRRLKTYVLRHAQVLVYRAGQLTRTPLASLMTVAVIGITLALPSALYLAIDQLQRVSRGWDAGGQISLFLKHDVTDATAQKLAERVRRLPAVARADYISRSAALAEFKRLSGFGEALEALERNPLPAVIVVHPLRERAAPDALAALLKDLRARDEVETAQLDLEWVRRLHALLDLTERGVFVLGGMLALAVLLIIGNTIRLAVADRRDEIEIMKLLGATDGFIRRPFLYTGLIQGVCGALAGWLIVQTTILLLSEPVQSLAALYGSTFEANGLGAGPSAALLAAGAVLGWAGARLAVAYHLAQLKPVEK